jgi:hypothetical protein
MIFFWFIIPFLVLMVLSGTRHQREEENEYEGGFEDEGGLEEDEKSNEEDNEGGKASLTPLWKFVTKLDVVGRGGGTIKFLCPHDFHQGKPYTGSYTRVRRHLCGMMEIDDNKGSLGINVFPNISKEQRQIYINLKEDAQRKHGKKQKLQSDDFSSRFGYTSPSPRRSTTYTSRRTIGDFFDTGGRDEVDTKVARFLYACGVPFNVLHSPYCHDMVRAINEKAPQGYRAPTMRKLELCYLTGKNQKFNSVFHSLQMNGLTLGYPLYRTVGQVLETNI